MFDPLLSRPLRTPPEYEVVLAERLRAEERRAVGRRAEESDFYGVLRPRTPSSRLPLRAIDTATALLLLSLREPGPLPAFALRTLGGDAAAAVARWVADGVLEVEAGGVFVSGPAALEGLVGPAAGPPVSRLARLSLAALESAAAFASDDLPRIAFQLYAAGRRPLDRSWRERIPALPEADGVLRYLFSGSAESVRLRFAADWRPSSRNERWLHWRSVRQGGTPPPESGAATWKLYVSPRTESLPETWGTIVEALVEEGAFEIKVGANAAGLLRPDKLVAYFGSQGALAEAADRLAARLEGAAAHGVPFTSELAGDGLLSWGVDPATGAEGSAESWRHWLVLRLAHSLAAARAAEEEGEGAVRFALARIGLEGVDVETWAPAELLRRELGATP